MFYAVLHEEFSLEYDRNSLLPVVDLLSHQWGYKIGLKISIGGSTGKDSVQSWCGITLLL